MAKENPKSSSPPLNKTRLVLFLAGVAVLSGLITYLYRNREIPKKKNKPVVSDGGLLTIPLPPTKRNLRPFKATPKHIYIEKKVFPYIRKHQKPIKDCYFGYKGPEKHPPKGGKVLLDFVIQPDGSVTNMRVLQRKPPSPLELKIKGIRACILQKAKTWKFPPPPKGKPVSLQYPFFFR